MLVCVLMFQAQEKESKRQDDPPSREDSLRIELLHTTDAKTPCDSYEKAKTCQEPTHWETSLNGKICRDRAKVESFIKGEADRHRVDPKFPEFSELKTAIVAEAGAPYAPVKAIMGLCGKNGLYKVDVSAKKTGFDGEKVKSALGLRFNVSDGQSKELYLFVGSQEDAPAAKSTRWAKYEDLEKSIEELIADRGPRNTIHVVIDAVGSTPYQEVLLLLDFMKKVQFQRVELAAPFEYKPEKK